MKNFIILLILFNSFLGKAQDGCYIFPKVKNQTRSSKFFSGTFLEFNSNLFFSNHASRKQFFVPVHLGIAQIIKKRIVLHAGLGGGRAFGEKIKKSEENNGAGRIGLDYFFQSALNGFGVGFYLHGIYFNQTEAAIPMCHLTYARSNNKLLNQYHFSFYPNSGNAIFALGLSLGFRM